MWKKNDSLELLCGALIKPFSDSSLFKTGNARWYVFHLSDYFEIYEGNIYVKGSSNLVNSLSNGVTDGYINKDSEITISGKAFIFLDDIVDESWFPNNPDVMIHQSQCIVNNYDYYYSDFGVYRKSATDTVRDFIVANAFMFTLKNGILKKDGIPHLLKSQSGIKTGQFIL